MLLLPIGELIDGSISNEFGTARLDNTYIKVSSLLL